MDLTCPFERVRLPGPDYLGVLCDLLGELRQLVVVLVVIAEEVKIGVEAVQHPPHCSQRFSFTLAVVGEHGA